jgi:hypothetical protein
MNLIPHHSCLIPVSKKEEDEMALYRATLVSFDSGAYTASVRLDGSQAQSLDGVTVSRALPSAEMTAGRRVLVDTGDHGGLADVVIYAVHT